MNNDKLYITPCDNGKFLTSDEAVKYLKKRVDINLSDSNIIMPFILGNFKIRDGKICFTVEDLDNFILTL